MEDNLEQGHANFSEQWCDRCTHTHIIDKDNEKAK